MVEGVSFGYHVRLPKCVAIVKPENEKHFRDVFAAEVSSGLRVVAVSTDGHSVDAQVAGGNLESSLGARYLGVGVGSPAFREGWVKQKKFYLVQTS